MSDPRDLGESAYEADARRWLLAYPPRWRRDREDEVVGVLLDTRAPHRRRLSASTRADLLRGAVGFRWRTRPPFVQWLLWRFGDVLPGPEHREWLVDDTDGRLGRFRALWLGWTGVLVVFLALLWTDLGRQMTVWAFAPALLCLVLSLGPGEGRARRIDRALAEQDLESALARGFDATVPWRPRRRWAWGARLLLPVVSLVVASAVAGVAALTALPAGQGGWATVTALVLGPDATLLLVPLAVLLFSMGSGAVQLHGAVVLCRRRVLTRPAQPWRAPVPVPWWLVLGGCVAAVVLPVGALLPRLGGLVGPWAGPGAGLVGPTSLVPMFCAMGLVVAWAVAVAGVLVWARTASARRAVPGPPLAVVDVLGSRGGDRVPVDPPVLLRDQGWVPYPPAP